MPISVYFFYEDTNFRLKPVRSTKSWIKEVVEREGKVLGSLNYVFCTDGVLSRMNAQYLNHNTLTDIITFNMSELSLTIEGEIYISIDRVKENAIKFKVPFGQELQRVMIHGVLHLIGYGDKTAGQKIIMRKKEDAYLSLAE
jgi:rRNA maturation RNase YbeY